MARASALNTIGVRAGFVYKTEDDLIEHIAARSLDAYTVPYTFTDIGVDGVRGTGDDRVLNYLGLTTAQATQLGSTQVVMNLPSTVATRRPKCR